MLPLFLLFLCITIPTWMCTLIYSAVQISSDSGGIIQIFANLKFYLQKHVNGTKDDIINRRYDLLLFLQTSDHDLASHLASSSS